MSNELTMTAGDYELALRNARYQGRFALLGDVIQMVNVFSDGLRAEEIVPHPDTPSETMEAIQEFINRVGKGMQQIAARLQSETAKLEVEFELLRQQGEASGCEQ